MIARIYCSFELGLCHHFRSQPKVLITSICSRIPYSFLSILLVVRNPHKQSDNGNRLDSSSRLPVGSDINVGSIALDMAFGVAIATSALVRSHVLIVRHVRIDHQYTLSRINHDLACSVNAH